MSVSVVSYLEVCFSWKIDDCILILVFSLAGISFLSIEQGFGSDNILNYEVVLSNGSIVDVNQPSLPDLYWALKFGSTNYGIVTRFDMTTYPLGQMWGGSRFFNISLGPPLLEYLVRFTDKLKEDPKGMSALSFTWVPPMGEYVIWSPNTYLKPEPFPALFSELESFTPFQDTLRVTTLVDITDEVSRSSPSGSRTQWFSLTFKADANLVWDVYTKGTQIFESTLQRPGTSWGLTVQPINAGLIAAGSRNGGNPSGLSEDDGDLLCTFIALFCVASHLFLFQWLLEPYSGRTPQTTTICISRRNNGLNGLRTQPESADCSIVSSI